MTEAELKRAARDSAVEYLVLKTYNLVLRSAGYDEDIIAEVEKRMMDGMAPLTIRKLDPAMSDHVAGEFQEALRDLLAAARAMR